MLKVTRMLEFSEWDRAVLKAPLPHPYQCSGFALALRDKGFEPWFLEIRSETPIGYCLVFVNQQRIANWFYGPVLLSPSMGLLSDTTGALVQFLSTHGILALEEALFPVQYKTPMDADAVQRDTKDSTTRYTPVIPLDKTPEELLASMHPAVRKNLKKCERAGVTVDFVTEGPLVLQYVHYLGEHRRRLGFPMPLFYPSPANLIYFSGPQCSLEIAVCRLKNEFLSGLGYLRFGKIIYEVAVAQSEACLTSKLPTQEAIKWAAIERYQAAGANYYDLAGISFRDNLKEENIRKFKLKFTQGVCAYHTQRTIIRWVPWASGKLRSKVASLASRYPRFHLATE